MQRKISEYLFINILASKAFLKTSSISSDHKIVKAAIKLGKKTYGSPTLSDQAALNCPSLKLGPGDSKSSLIADEFIYLDEIEIAHKDLEGRKILGPAVIIPN